MLKQLLCSILIISPSYSSELDFFQKNENKIDYWNEYRKSEPKAPKKIIETAKKQISPKKKYSWKTYLKPKSIDDLKEVFREGDHTPPVPLLIGIQNPSYENAKNWLSYIRLKNRLSGPFLDKIKEVKLSEQNPKRKVAIQNIERRVMQNAVIARDWDRFRFRMYFDSSCPHCKRMFATLGELKKRGFYVEAIQVDSGPSPRVDVPIFRASPNELEKYKNERVPFTLVADIKRNQLVGPVRGYHSISSVISFLKQVRSVN